MNIPEGFNSHNGAGIPQTVHHDDLVEVIVSKGKSQKRIKGPARFFGWVDSDDERVTAYRVY